MKKAPVMVRDLTGRERERRDVVAWLRQQARECKARDNQPFSNALRNAAFQIEYGDHRRKPHD
jgi:hypothetical protein